MPELFNDYALAILVMCAFRYSFRIGNSRLTINSVCLRQDVAPQPSPYDVRLGGLGIEAWCNESSVRLQSSVSASWITHGPRTVTKARLGNDTDTG